MPSKSYPVPQRDPPLSPRLTLPTMYDLPSEDPQEPGLPDEYHDLQPQFLSRTFRTPHYSPNNLFTGTDINLYYDVRHALWHKRPDWFVALGVPRLYDEVDMRASYVVWQEGINPFIVIELLSPGTAKEDLGPYGEEEETELTPMVLESLATDNGQTAKEKPPRKWEVYQNILRIPYYMVFSRYTNRLRCFKLMGAVYQEQTLSPDNPRVWIAELEIGLGLWFGEFEGITRLWLRWCDQQGNWIPTDTEQERSRAEQERTRAEEAELKLRQVVENLSQTGMSMEQIAQLTGLSSLIVQNLLRD